MPELVLRLRVAGNADVEAALRSLQSEAKKVEATLEPLNQQNRRMGDSTRVAIRAWGDFAQMLSGTSALLSIVARDNKALQDTLEKVTVAFALTSAAINVMRNAAQLAQGAMVGLRVAIAATVAPLAVLVAAAAALGLGLGLFIRRAQGAASAAEEAGASVRGFTVDLTDSGLAASGSAVALAGFEDHLVSLTDLARRARDLVSGLSLSLKGLLDPSEIGSILSVPTPATKEFEREAKSAADRAAAAAKQAAEKARALEEKRFQDQAQQIVDFNIWQRQEWERAAEARTRVTIAAIDKIIEAEERLKEETVDLVQRANQAAIDAIEERMEEQRRAVEQMLEEERRLSDETEDLVRRANQAVIDGIEDQMEAQRRAALATKPLWVQQAENAKKAAQDIAESLHGAITNALFDALTTARDIFDAISNIARSVFNEIARLLISFGVRSFLKWIGLPFAKGGIVQGGLVPAFAGMQHGGRIDRPTLAFMGEGGQSEAVVPLPDNRSIPVKFTGDRGADREVALRIIVQNVWGDPNQVKTSPDEIKAVVVNDIQNRGQIMKAIRIVIP